MRKVLATLLLITVPAYGQDTDAPLLQLQEEGPVVLRIHQGLVNTDVVDKDGTVTQEAVMVGAGFYINDLFAHNVENRVKGLMEDKARLEAERDSYKAQAIEANSQPGLNLPLVVGLVVGGLALGLAGGLVVSNAK